MPFNQEPNRFEFSFDNGEENWLEENPFWELLSTYADGEATPEEIQQVEALLAADPHLAQELRFLTSTHTLTATTPEVEPPLTLRSQILSATSQRPTLRKRAAKLISSWRIPALNRYAMPLGAVTVTAALTFILLTKQEERREGYTGIEVTRGNTDAEEPRGVQDESTFPKQDFLPAPKAPLLPNRQNPAPFSKPARPVAVAKIGTPGHNQTIGLHSTPPQRKSIDALPKGINVANKLTTKPTHNLDIEKPKESVIPADYTPKPMMDAENQRPAVQMAKAVVEIPEVKSHETEISESTPSSAQPTTTVALASTSDAERMKARLRQSRQILLAEGGRNRRLPADTVFRGASEQDASIRIVDNLKRSQSSALFMGRF
jgi:hypothetical protein